MTITGTRAIVDALALIDLDELRREEAELTRALAAVRGLLRALNDYDAAGLLPARPDGAGVSLRDAVARAQRMGLHVTSTVPATPVDGDGSRAELERERARELDAQARFLDRQDARRREAEQAAAEENVTRLTIVETPPPPDPHDVPRTAEDGPPAGVVGLEGPWFCPSCAAYLLGSYGPGPRTCGTCHTPAIVKPLPPIDEDLVDTAPTGSAAAAVEEANAEDRYGPVYDGRDGSIEEPHDDELDDLEDPVPPPDEGDPGLDSPPAGEERASTDDGFEERIADAEAAEAETVREEEEDDRPTIAETAPAAEPSSQDEPPATASTERSPAAAALLPLFQSRPGEWLGSSALAKEAGVDVARAAPACRELVDAGELEHNGKGGAHSKFRAPGHGPDVDDQADDEPAEDAPRATVESPNEVRERLIRDGVIKPAEPAPAPRPEVSGRTRRVMEAEARRAAENRDRVAGAEPAAIDPQTGTLEGRITEALSYQPATIALLARRLSITNGDELRELAVTIGRLVDAGDVERVGRRDGGSGPTVYGARAA